VDCKKGCVYEKENKLNTIVNEESEVKGKNISLCHDFALCSKFKLQEKTSLGPPSRISHLDANKFMEHHHQSYAHITF
jgi:hypothetical protein